MTELGDYDVIILGGGLGGLTAALFSARQGRSTLVLEAGVPGGHLVNVEKIEDFPGFSEGIAGYELCPMVQEQAANHGAAFQMAEVQRLEAQEPHWLIETGEGHYRAKAVIVATGSRPKELGVPGEERLRGRGVSHCASCDGPLFRGQVIGVVGSGDSALQEALTLAEHASQVILFNRRAAFSAQHTYQQRVAAHATIRARHNTAIDKILGDDVVTGVRIRDLATDEVAEVELSGIFVYVGLEPNTGFLRDLLRLNSDGSVPTDVWMRTELPGLFAVGDIRQDSARQAITSAGDGAVAALAAHRYIVEHLRDRG